ncbi:TATA box-binding protein-associated factor RNA polymerase I subunit B isoform X2 [Microcaecilia unicolor]|uniref:TATA box-binding protein-associated factor RNA polymerase I subunit B n=1 Tax=Microcaecilia unicolor TaxID=1415580 RepID=A0A6P7XVN8_9AMPH|nr:TATA box-binding protein-associated factor RNA polymerase I subunit B isoform X2 [Microcaecilia unicolor]
MRRSCVLRDSGPQKENFEIFGGQFQSDYKEPCPQCAAVNWGITDEGRFYCKACHNVIEKTQDVISDEFAHNTKIQSISRGLKRKRGLDKGWQWYVCEGFQFILLKQAEALLTLGICSRLKDEVLCNFWRRYLQKSKQAYSKTLAHTRSRECAISENSSNGSEWPTDLEDLILDAPSSFSETEEFNFAAHSRSISSDTDASDTTSVRSGSLDGMSYLRPGQKGELLMSMPMTLAFCYMALLWMREPVTLVDLLRFVAGGHVPYLHVFDQFPEEMKLFGPDIRIFQVQSLPSYNGVFEKTHALAAFLDLTCFPPITEKCFLHPNILCIKYLMEANLPDELHNWTARVVKKTELGDVAFLRFDPIAKKRMVRYEVQAAALIVVVLKLLFLLDDRYEWLLSSFVGKRNKKNKEDTPWFDFRKWYKVMKSALDEAQKKVEEERARYPWKSEMPLFYSKENKWVVCKRKQMLVSLQQQFGKLVGSLQAVKKQNPSSFQFNWDEENTDMNCFLGHSLEGVMQEKGKSFTTVNPRYWLGTVKLCKKK